MLWDFFIHFQFIHSKIPNIVNRTILGIVITVNTYTRLTAECVPSTDIMYDPLILQTITSGR